MSALVFDNLKMFNLTWEQTLMTRGNEINEGIPEMWIQRTIEEVFTCTERVIVVSEWERHCPELTTKHVTRGYSCHQPVHGSEEKTRTRTAWSWTAKGSCPKGERCIFEHDQAQKDKGTVRWRNPPLWDNSDESPCDRKSGRSPSGSEDWPPCYNYKIGLSSKDRENGECWGKGLSIRPPAKTRIDLAVFYNLTRTQENCQEQDTATMTVWYDEPSKWVSNYLHTFMWEPRMKSE